MKTRTRITIGLGLAGCTAILFTLLPTGSPDTRAAAPKRKPVVTQPLAVVQPPAAKPNAPHQSRPVEDEPLLPSPVLAAEPQAAPPIPAEALLFKRPVGESMMSTWASRDPEGAGQWLNQNRTHPQFADMVRGYAIQISTIDPAAARQWAAQLNGIGNRFNAGGGTLEQHIDAIETMLSRPATEYAAELANAHKSSATLQLPDYIPRLVRQNPGEDPVIEMEPVNPFI